jgi:hypothetical protein
LLHKLRSPPFLDVLICVAIIALNVALASKMRFASDALFLEGMPLSILGATIVLVTKKPLRISRRVPAVRILVIGAVLVLVSIIIGEALNVG